MYGTRIVVANIDNVGSPGNITFKNEGIITGHASQGLYTPSGASGNADVGNYIFGGFSYGDRGVDTIENGSTGQVRFYAPSSMGWGLTAAATQQIRRNIINNGIMELWGKNSIGVANDMNGSPTQIAYANIELNNPIKLLGDSSVGVNITNQPDNSSTNFTKSLEKADKKL